MWLSPPLQMKIETQQKTKRSIYKLLYKCKVITTPGIEPSLTVCIIGYTVVLPLHYVVWIGCPLIR